MLDDCDEESRYFINTFKQIDDTDNESNSIVCEAWQKSYLGYVSSGAMI